ncbi:catabolite repressor/activator [Celerinatantimonas yamalensis]|uniref:Catabolite repressor/activator n=1 Tax=Celerinatantimonas yamalensis TaxID=559956 RepID=A0ABW9G7D7_9GAMM
MKLEEIARLAGVSRTTASAVVNGKAQQYRLSAKTVARVMAVVEQHKYQPNQTAAHLRSGASRSLGFIVPDLENASYAKLAKHLEQGARERGYQLIISCSDDLPEVEIQLAQSLISRGVDALLVASSLPPNNEFYPKLLRAGKPIIAIDRLLDPALFANVTSENFEGAASLTRASIEPNMQRVAMIGALPQLLVSSEREAGIYHTLEQHLPQADYQCFYGHHFSQEQGAVLMNKALNWQPDLIITTAYVLLEGGLEQLVRRPEWLQKIRLATFGDNRLLDFLPHPINGLAQQMPVLAERATNIALRAINGDYPVGVEVVPRRLIVRSPNALQRPSKAFPSEALWR